VIRNGTKALNDFGNLLKKLIVSVIVIYIKDTISKVNSGKLVENRRGDRQAQSRRPGSPLLAFPLFLGWSSTLWRGYEKRKTQ
jgi:hypothetical protein